jgi:hypothetical protein
MTIAMAAMVLLPFAVCVPRLLDDGGTLTGVNGVLPTDQLHYFGQIYEAGHFHRVFDHFPMFFVSGLFARAGLDIRLAFLLWIPLAAVVLVAGFDRYIRELLPARSRIPALVLALFYLSPLVALLGWTAYDHGDDLNQLLFTGYYLFPAGSLWGYPQIAFTLGLMPVCLLNSLSRERPATVIAALSGAVVSFLHPWQGVTLLGVNGLTLATSRAARRPQMLIMLAATAAPLGVYRLAAHSDPRLNLLVHNTSLGHAPLWVVVVALVPLVLAAFGVSRARLDSPSELQLVLWPLVGLVCYWVLDLSWQPYFLLGVTLPLAILAVRGWDRLVGSGRTTLAVACIVLVTVPGTVWAADELRGRVADAHGLYVFERDDKQALDYVKHAPRPGHVLASGYLAPAAWPFTGRMSYAASSLLSGDYAVGRAEAARLFSGSMQPDVARRFVNRIGAVYVIAGCEAKAPDLRSALGQLVAGTRRFGCATVYEIART